MTLENVSPWLREVKRTRPVIILSEDVETDVAVIGGGISGIATTYFLLRDTNLNVILMEKGRVAQGATGHNGGQAVAAFERTLIDLCEKFGEDKVSEGLREVNSAWKLLYSIISETGIDVQIQEVTAHLGLSSLEDVRIMLRERKLLDRLGLQESGILLAEDVAGDIPEVCQLLVKRTPRKELNELLLTRDSDYICDHMMRTALMNSALFCEELAVWMLNKYPGRFRVYEDTPVQRIKLGNGSFDGKGNRASLETGKNLVNAKHAVLCTNGYNDLEIEGMGVSIDTAIKGLIGFMVGYMHREESGAAASVYFSARRSGEEGYFYMTRRRYIDRPNRELTCVGGPDLPLGPKEKYFSESALKRKEIIQGLKNSIGRRSSTHSRMLRATSPGMV